MPSDTRTEVSLEDQTMIKNVKGLRGRKPLGFHFPILVVVKKTTMLICLLSKRQTETYAINIVLWKPRNQGPRAQECLRVVGAVLENLLNDI